MIYIKDLPYPSQMANVIQSTKMCEAFGKITNLELWVPSGKTQQISMAKLKQDYDCESTFRVQKVWALFHQFEANILKIIISYLFKLSFYPACFLKLLQTKTPTVLHSREPEAIIVNKFANLFLRHKKPSIFEIHEPPNHWYVKLLFPWALKFADQRIVISHGLQKYLHDRGVSSVVFPDGVEQAWLKQKKANSGGIKKLSRIKGKQVIFYAGSKLDWKGVDILEKAALMDKNPNHLYVFVGFGRNDTQNSLYIPRVKRSDLPKYYALADCFILPNSGNSDISKFYTSPLKLFEYLAMRKPLVSSDLPSIREIITAEHAWFFETDNPKNLLKTINNVLKLPAKDQRKKVQAGFDLVKKYTWEKRAEGILEII